MTVIIVVVKLKFLHYNLLFPIVLIITIAFTLKKCILSEDHKFFFVGLLVLNFLCLVAPDKMVYKLRKSHRYFWSTKPLDVSFFKFKRNDEDDTAATVHPVIIGEINKVYNYPPSILFTSDYLGNHSWIDTTFFDDSPEGIKALEELLDHEKRHLDITEVYTRKAEDSLNKMIFSSYAEKYEAANYFFKISDSIQDIFDSETDHGLKEAQTNKWNVRIKQELENK